MFLWYLEPNPRPFVLGVWTQQVAQAQSFQDTNEMVTPCLNGRYISTLPTRSYGWRPRKGSRVRVLA